MLTAVFVSPVEPCTVASSRVDSSRVEIESCNRSGRNPTESRLGGGVVPWLHSRTGRYEDEEDHPLTKQIPDTVCHLGGNIHEAVACGRAFVHVDGNILRLRNETNFPLLLARLHGRYQEAGLIRPCPRHAPAPRCSVHYCVVQLMPRRPVCSADAPRSPFPPCVSQSVISRTRSKCITPYTTEWCM